MTNNSEIAHNLTEALSLAGPPVAVCLANEVPADVERWSGHSPAGCRFWQEAQSRVFATAPPDHGLCSIGQYTHGLEMTGASQADLGDALRVFADLTYVREQDIAAIPVLARQPKYVVYGPLADVPLAPDVVLLFVRPDQILILSEASQQVEGGLPPAMGRPACAIIPQTKNSGGSALSLGCCGARAYLDVLRDDTALYAISGSVLDAFTERVTALAKANAILTQFHRVRRRDVEAGKSPTVKESLAAMG
jgi:uncharacterized protein (DUF169 family)